MLLAIDAGNTNICFAVYDDKTQKKLWRLETQKPVDDIFEEIKSEYPHIKDVIICSVVPITNEPLTKACQKYLDTTPDFITHENIDIKINIDTPKQLGADRMVGASAAVKFYQAPAIVVDFGTSTNFDVIDSNGAHCGGVLATGARLSLSALSDRAAQLPEIKIEKPKKVIGTNTIDAMQSGIYWGYIGLVEGTVKRISEEMGVKPFVIATGGLAPLYMQGTQIFDILDQDLLMKGLVHMHKVIKGHK